MIADKIVHGLLSVCVRSKRFIVENRMISPSVEADKKGSDSRVPRAEQFYLHRFSSPEHKLGSARTNGASILARRCFHSAQGLSIFFSVTTIKKFYRFLVRQLMAINLPTVAEG